ncbi:hypothetical protein [Nocardia donostiensis]|uniref:hypothetical protein n=1 Tax=Nocardia donostiensis TaxID=1538463 RepID=UPI0011156FC2|nr:hypothetical protein [Nocardia donostiensis]
MAPSRRKTKPLFIGSHAFRNRLNANVKTGFDASGNPVHAIVRMDGRNFGNFLVTNPDFWRLVELNGGDVVFYGCGLADGERSFAEMVARGAQSHGLDRTIYAPSGETLTQAHNPDGTLQATPLKDATDGPPWLKWWENPTRSSIAVIDGRFWGFHPPSALAAAA